MNAYILCPGPSLKNHPKIGFSWGEPGLIICVNKARDFVDHHDWWVAGDVGKTPELIVDHRTHRGVFSVYDYPNLDRPPYPPLVNMLWSSLDIDPTSYSSIAALELAFVLGFTEVHIYGHDMVGSTYYDGTDIGMEPENRWARETNLWNEAITRLKKSPFQFNVTRH